MVPVVLASWVAFVAGDGETVQLTCERGQCSVESGYLWVTTAQSRFAAEEIVGSDESSNGNEVRVRLYRRDRSAIVFYLDAFGGSSDYEAIRAYLADPAGELSVTAVPGIFLWILFAMGSLLLAGTAMHLFRYPSAIELVVDTEAIEITERWPLRTRRRRLPLEHATEVRLLEQPARTWFDPDSHGAIVQVVDAGGRVRPITTVTYPGVEVHRAAAEAIRKALGLDAPAQDDDDDDWDDDDR